MNRKYQVRLCAVCKNRTFNKTDGTICGLTNQIPSFSRSCPDFDKDEEEWQRITTSKFKKYELDQKPALWEELLDNETSTTRLTHQGAVENITSLGGLPARLKVKKSLGKHITAAIPLVIFGILLSVMFETGVTGTILIFLCCLVTGLGWIILGFNGDNHVFEISKAGIHQDGDLIAWNIIIATIIRESKYRKQLIIAITASSDIEIELSQLDQSADRIESYLFHYRNQYLSELQSQDL